MRLLHLFQALQIKCGVYFHSAVKHRTRGDVSSVVAHSNGAKTSLLWNSLLQGECLCVPPLEEGRRFRSTYGIADGKHLLPLGVSFNFGKSDSLKEVFYPLRCIPSHLGVFPALCHVPHKGTPIFADGNDACPVRTEVEIVDFLLVRARHLRKCPEAEEAVTAASRQHLVRRTHPHALLVRLRCAKIGPSLFKGVKFETQR